MTDDERTHLIDQLADAALAAAADSRWEDVGLKTMAIAASVSLADCHRAGVTRERVREELDHRLDRAMLAQAGDDTDAAATDRLFEVLMARFDALEADRAGWTSILMTEASDPLLQAGRVARRAVTAGWALEAAAIPAAGVDGALRRAGLVRLLRRCEESWLQDGPDLARTMRVLDEGLKKGASTLKTLQRAGGGLGGLGQALAAMAGDLRSTPRSSRTDPAPDSA